MKRAKLMAGGLAAWLLFWLGHAVSRVMRWTDAGWLYPVYSWLMLASVDAQEWGGNAGPWGAVCSDSRPPA